MFASFHLIHSIVLHAHHNKLPARVQVARSLIAKPAKNPFLRQPVDPEAKKGAALFL
jgi:hypothetical protein